MLRTNLLNRRRIAWQLPASIALLLLVVVGWLSSVAYREVREAALAAAGDRLHHASDQLAELMAQAAEQRIDETRQVAEDPAVISLATTAEPADATGAIAFEALEGLRGSSAQIAVVELWDASGTRIVAAYGEATGDTLAGGTPPRWARDGATVSGFRSREGTTWYDVAVPVRSAAEVVGYVVQARRLASSPAAAVLIANLIGNDAIFLIGEPGGAWTDLSRLVDGPPGFDPEEIQAYAGSDGTWRLGVGRPIAGTPWVVWVAFPRADVLARANAFAGRMAGTGLLIVVVGALGGWTLSRRLTAPLGRLQEAASAIAGGDLARRVPVEGPDELHRVGVAFNEMARQVQHSQGRLEGLVAERTAELHASVEQFHALTTSAHDAIVTADGSGCITYFNPGAGRIFGYEAEEVLGKPLTILMPERLHEAHTTAFGRYLEADETRAVGRTMELVGRRRDGAEFPLELSLASWRRDGNPEFGGIIRDISARKEAERELHRYTQELEAANREMEAFSYSVSHDLRQPLRAIHGFSQALVEDFSDRLDAEGTDYLRRVCAAADRMGTLIDDLLELSRVSRTEIRRDSVDLGELARRIAADLGQRTPDREVELRIAEGLEAKGDRTLLEVVLQNLLGNAWKFTSRRPHSVVEVGSTDGGERAFFVRDDGVGFDMEYVDKLFGVFQRLHAPSDFPGTGVGLAIVQRIVHRHGGRVWAEAEPGRGATFYFTLPDG